MQRLIIILLVFGVAAFKLSAQEFKVNVTVQTPQLKLAEPKVFKQMEKSISEFYNNTKWTEDDYEDYEKIELNININITNELSPSSFVADFSFQSVRPVFNTNYKTVTLNWIDKGYSFNYEELQTIELSTTVFIDDLSAILTYYGYLVLGLDYDSFSIFGGDRYYDKAREVVDNVPLTNQNIKSWNSNGKKNNRFWVVDYLRNSKLRGYRQAYYDYHRAGLDVMNKELDKGRAVILSSLKELKKLEELIPECPIVRLFINGKKSEIIELFKGAGYAQGNTVYNLMSEVDPSGIEDYKDITKR